MSLLLLGGYAAAGSEAPIPVYSANDLHLDTTGLKPVRLLYDPSEGINGPDEGLFADGLYRKPQVAIALERTVYYPAQDQAKDAVRIRWTANTHSHVDEILVDAETLGTINERTRAGRNWQTKDELIYLRDGQAQVLSISDAGAPTRTTYSLSHPEHYGLMVLPFLFASMDLPPGARFRLPAVGSKKEGYVEVSVIGPATFTDSIGREQTATRVTSRHGWAEIDWYVSREPPYHRHAVWRYMSDGVLTVSAVSRVIDWVVFEADAYRNLVDESKLRKTPK